jgi:hypothetical protein
LIDNYSEEFARQEIDGDFVAFEGLVYSEFSPGVHIVQPFEIPDHWRKVRAIDYGYQNPFACIWGALDEDNRLYIYDEYYKTKTLLSRHAEAIKERKGKFEFTVADHDAQDNAEMLACGVGTTRAKKDVMLGIQKVKGRLKVQADGKPLSRAIPSKGQEFGASRDGGTRAHRAWDYAFERGKGNLTLTGGARWIGVTKGSYGDEARFRTPDGKVYRIIHGNFSRGGGQGGRSMPARGTMTGQATFYTGSGGSDGVLGGKTANGETFTGRQMTAAVQLSLRPKLMNKWLIVEDASTGRRIRVWANDTGSMGGTNSRPAGRLIDLSPVAFIKLFGSTSRGVGNIRVMVDPNQRGRP